MYRAFVKLGAMISIDKQPFVHVDGHPIVSKFTMTGSAVEEAQAIMAT
jgi:hypothetical protein